jgi:hypothetical protein
VSVGHDLVLISPELHVHSITLATVRDMTFAYVNHRIKCENAHDYVDMTDEQDMYRSQNYMHILMGKLTCGGRVWVLGFTDCRQL